MAGSVIDQAEGSAAIILKTAVARSAPNTAWRGPCRRSKADGRQRRFLAGSGCMRTSATRRGQHERRVSSKTIGSGRTRVDPQQPSSRSIRLSRSGHWMAMQRSRDPPYSCSRTLKWTCSRREREGTLRAPVKSEGSGSVQHCFTPVPVAVRSSDRLAVSLVPREAARWP